MRAMRKHGVEMAESYPELHDKIANIKGLATDIASDHTAINKSISKMTCFKCGYDVGVVSGGIYRSLLCARCNEYIYAKERGEIEFGF